MSVAVTAPADALDPVAFALAAGFDPPLEWAVRWSAEGRDALHAAWDASRDATLMSLVVDLPVPVLEAIVERQKQHRDRYHEASGRVHDPNADESRAWRDLSAAEDDWMVADADMHKAKAGDAVAWLRARVYPLPLRFYLTEGATTR